MALSDENLSLIAFKNLQGKSHTDITKGLGNEAEGIFLNVSSDSIFIDAIDSDPTVASANNIVEFVQDAVLTLDNTSNGHAYFASYPVGHPNAGQRIRNAVNPAYGFLYEVKPKDSTNSSIAVNDPREWIYQYNSGIFFQENVVGDAPTTIDVYVYTGSYLSDFTNGTNGNISGDLAVNTTHSDLTLLKDNNSLSIGTKYLITDYTTKHQIPFTTDIHEDVVEPILLTATSNNEFSPSVYSTLYPNDLLAYDIDNVLCEDGSTPRKGFITRRIDTKNNIETPYDWRNVKFRRYSMSGMKFHPTSTSDVGAVTNYDVTVETRSFNNSGNYFESYVEFHDLNNDANPTISVTKGGTTVVKDLVDVGGNQLTAGQLSSLVSSDKALIIYSPTYDAIIVTVDDFITSPFTDETLTGYYHTNTLAAFGGDREYGHADYFTFPPQHYQTIDFDESDFIDVYTFANKKEPDIKNARVDYKSSHNLSNVYVENDSDGALWQYPNSRMDISYCENSTFVSFNSTLDIEIVRASIIINSHKIKGVTIEGSIIYYFENTNFDEISFATLMGGSNNTNKHSKISFKDVTNSTVRILEGKRSEYLSSINNSFINLSSGTGVTFQGLLDGVSSDMITNASNKTLIGSKVNIHLSLDDFSGNTNFSNLEINNTTSKYKTTPTISDPLDLVHKDYVDSLSGSGDISNLNVSSTANDLTVQVNSTSGTAQIINNLTATLDGSNFLDLDINGVTVSADLSSLADAQFIPNVTVESQSNYLNVDVNGSSGSANIIENLELSVLEYNVSSATNQQTFSFTSQDSSPNAIRFIDNGSILYMVGDNCNSVYQYNLTTPYDITTMSYSGNSLSVNAQGSTPRGIDINDSGSLMVIVNNNVLYEYSLTAFDISTATYTSNNFSFGSEDSIIRGISYNSDGSKLYAIGQGNSRIYEYNLSTNYDITTMSYSGQFLNVSGELAFDTDLVVAPNNTTILAVSSADEIVRYEMSTPNDITTASYANDLFAIPSGTTTGVDLDPINYRIYACDFSSDNLYQYDIDKPLLLINANNIESSINLSDINKEHTVETSILKPYTITKATANGNYDVSAVENSLYRFEISNDGTIALISGIQNDGVLSYNLSTPYDVTSATYSGNSFFISTSTRDFKINNDGTELYALVGSTLTKYDLSTPYDITTISLNGDTFSFGTEDSQAFTFCFSTDGLKMYMSGLNSNTIYEYTMSSAYDITSSVYTGNNLSLASESSNNFGININGDGSQIFTVSVNTDAVQIYSMATPYDLSTASYTESYSLTGIGNPYGISFGNNGIKMYITDNNPDLIYQFDLPKPSLITKVDDVEALTTIEDIGEYLEISSSSQDSRVDDILAGTLPLNNGVTPTTD